MDDMIHKNVHNILQLWKAAGDYNKRETAKICKKFGIKKEPVSVDEEWTEWEHKDSGKRFEASHYDDGGEEEKLTEDERKFSRQSYGINEESYSRFKMAMERTGFSNVDDDQYYTIWEKDGKKYEVTNYATEESDIQVSEAGKNEIQ